MGNEDLQTRQSPADMVSEAMIQAYLEKLHGTAKQSTTQQTTTTTATNVRV